MAAMKMCAALFFFALLAIVSADDKCSIAYPGFYSSDDDIVKWRSGCQFIASGQFGQNVRPIGSRDGLDFEDCKKWCVISKPCNMFSHQDEKIRGKKGACYLGTGLTGDSPAQSYNNYNNQDKYRCGFIPSRFPFGQVLPIPPFKMDA